MYTLSSGDESKALMEEVPCCRVCHGESEVNNPLYYPCKCDGSIKYVHQECLMEWIRVSKKKFPTCELCGESFQFQHVYASNAPNQLTIWEIFKELSPRVWKTVKIVFNFFSATFAWGFLLPLFTNWWITFNWCLVFNDEAGNCGLVDYSSLSSLEYITSSWYHGVVHACILVAVSMICFEVGHLMFKELEIAEHNQRVRLLEERIAENARELTRYKEARRMEEIKKLATADYISLRNEWSYEKQVKVWYTNQYFDVYTLPVQQFTISNMDDLIRSIQLDLKFCKRIIAKVDEIQLGNAMETNNFEYAKAIYLKLSVKLEQLESLMIMKRELHVKLDQQIMVSTEFKEDYTQYASGHGDVVDDSTELFLNSSLKTTSSTAPPAMAERELLMGDEFSYILEPSFEGFDLESMIENEKLSKIVKESFINTESSNFKADIKQELIEEKQSYELEAKIPVENEVALLDIDTMEGAKGAKVTETRRTESDINATDDMETNSIELPTIEAGLRASEVANVAELMQENVRNEVPMDNNAVAEPQPNDPNPMNDELLGGVVVINPPAGDVIAPLVPLGPRRLDGLIEPGEGLQAFHLTYSHLFVTIVFIGVFTFTLIVVPATFGRMIFDLEYHSGLKRSIRSGVVHSLQDEEHFLLVQNFFMVDTTDFRSSNMAEEKMILSEIIFSKVKVFIEIFIGYGVLAMICFMAIVYYRLRYVRVIPIRYQFSIQYFIKTQTKVILDVCDSVTKITIATAMYFIILPIGVAMLTSKILFKTLSPEVVALVDSLENDVTSSFRSSEPIYYLMTIITMLLSYLVCAHIAFIAIELRQLIDAKYLQGILPNRDWMNHIGIVPQGDQQLQPIGAFNDALIELQHHHPHHLDPPHPPPPLHNRPAPPITYSRILKTFLTNVAILIPGILFSFALPIRYGHLFSLGIIGPLNLRFNTSFTDLQIPVEMILSHVLIPLLIEKMKYRTIIRSFLQKFLRVTSNFLEIEWILSRDAFPNPTNASLTTDPIETVSVYNKIKNFVTNQSTEVRLALAVSLGFFALLIMSSGVIHVPLLLGRLTLGLLSIPTNNDLFNYPAGLILSWALSWIILFIGKDVMGNPNLYSFINVLAKWAWIAAKVVVLGAVWCVVPPLLIGYLLEALFLIPYRNSIFETPQYAFLQCWAVGLIVLKVWARFILTGVFGDNELRRQMEMVINRGIHQIDEMQILNHILLPIIVQLMDLIFIPYFVARFLSIFVRSYLIRTIMVRYATHIYIALRLIRFVAVTCYRNLISLHNEIRDSRYLIGMKLTNRR